MTNSKTILIVDDEEDIVGALGFFLRRKGMEVLTAVNGLEALAVIQAAVKKPDLILLDRNMPVMSGTEFLEARKVRNIEASIPVILLSSELWEVNDSGVVGHISKPFDLLNLMEKIDFHLKQMTDNALDVIHGKSVPFRN